VEAGSFNHPAVQGGAVPTRLLMSAVIGVADNAPDARCAPLVSGSRPARLRPPASLWPVFANGVSLPSLRRGPGWVVGSLGSFRARCSVAVLLAPRPALSCLRSSPSCSALCPVFGASRLAPALAGLCSWPWVGGGCGFGCPRLGPFRWPSPLSPPTGVGLRDSNQQPSPSPGVQLRTSGIRSCSTDASCSKG